MSDDVVEKVARALCVARGRDPEQPCQFPDGTTNLYWQWDEPMARAAIAAMPYVPREAGRCTCRAGEFCPLGKTGQSCACTADELRAQLLNTGLYSDELRARILKAKGKSPTPPASELHDP
jgi:hypothetical protein